MDLSDSVMIQNFTPADDFQTDMTWPNPTLSAADWLTFKSSSDSSPQSPPLCRLSA